MSVELLPPFLLTSSSLLVHCIAHPDHTEPSRKQIITQAEEYLQVHYPPIVDSEFINTQIEGLDNRDLVILGQYFFSEEIQQIVDYDIYRRLVDLAFTRAQENGLNQTENPLHHPTTMIQITQGYQRSHSLDFHPFSTITKVEIYIEAESVELEKALDQAEYLDTIEDVSIEEMRHVIRTISYHRQNLRKLRDFSNQLRPTQPTP